MRPFLLLLALGPVFAACGAASTGATPKPDAGHDATPDRMEDTSTPAIDSGCPIVTDALCTPCTPVGPVWASMDKQPIYLADPLNKGHRMVAGVDLDGPDGTGITVQIAETVLCPGTPLGKGPGGTRIEGWGVSNEVRFAYDPTTFHVEEVALFPGYVGVMTLPTDPAGPDAGHTFTLGLGAVELDGAPFVIDWTDHDFVNGNELYNALQYNSACYGGYDATPCGETGACTITMTGGKRQWSIDEIEASFTFQLGSTEAAESTVIEIDMTP
jgi:hypothetical protein